MKKYCVHADEFFCTSSIEDEYGQWVPAEVAQALYDALIKSVEHMDTVNTPSNHSVVIEATQAISLADGVSSNAEG